MKEEKNCLNCVYCRIVEPKGVKMPVCDAGSGLACFIVNEVKEAENFVDYEPAEVKK